MTAAAATITHDDGRLGQARSRVSAPSIAGPPPRATPPAANSIG